MHSAIDGSAGGFGGALSGGNGGKVGAAVGVGTEAAPFKVNVAEQDEVELE